MDFPSVSMRNLQLFDQLNYLLIQLIVSEWLFHSISNITLATRDCVLMRVHTQFFVRKVSSVNLDGSQDTSIEDTDTLCERGYAFAPQIILPWLYSHSQQQLRDWRDQGRSLEVQHHFGRYKEASTKQPAIEIIDETGLFNAWWHFLLCCIDPVSS